MEHCNWYETEDQGLEPTSKSRKSFISNTVRHFSGSYKNENATKSKKSWGTNYS